MTEEISQVYENVDIKAWAKQIRNNKIREFADAIDEKKKEARAYIEMDLSGYTLPKALDEIARGLVIAVDLCRMEIKLDMLKQKTIINEALKKA
jgi:hypothetical protein